jgi:MinD-like ATPase involved in chromosome partitioning or flagellar assembly
MTIFAGHYGSGKTSVAVNYALRLKESRANVAIADLDIVNPYFRTKDSAKVLQESGIRLISSAYANSNLDVPSVPGEMNAIFDEPSCHAVIDVGGDDRGALALGRYRQKLQNNDTAAFVVVNMYRPLSRDAGATAEIMQEIERAGGIHFTGIINNSNLGTVTTPEDIINSIPYAEEIAEKTKLPLVMTSVKRSLAAGLEPYIKNLFPIDLEEYEWQK